MFAETRRKYRILAEEAGVEPTEDAKAPSNGFEARAPHRERYSSAANNAVPRGACLAAVCAAAHANTYSEFQLTLRYHLRQQQIIK
jgi:hypothetical protein